MRVGKGELSQKVIDMMPEADRKALGLEGTVECGVKTERLVAGLERDIQADVEGWLRLNGFWPRTPEYLDGREPPKGWYIHLHEAKRNPIVLDLLILGRDGRYLEVELKTVSGRVRDSQKVLCSQGGELCRSVKDAIEVIGGWIAEGEV